MPSYQYLRELFSQANQHALTARRAASNKAQTDYTGFESFSLPQQQGAVVYSPEGLCDLDCKSANDVRAARSPGAWKPQPFYHHRYTTSSPNSIITLRDACFLQELQQHHCRRRAAVVGDCLESVGSRHHGRSSPGKVTVATDSTPRQDVDELLFTDAFLMRSLDEIFTNDDCDQPRRCINPFDNESMDGRDCDVPSIGSFDDGDDALDLSLLGALDMNW
jgi:hypothetical protein